MRTPRDNEGYDVRDDITVEDESASDDKLEEALTELVNKWEKYSASPFSKDTAPEIWATDYALRVQAAECASDLKVVLRKLRANQFKSRLTTLLTGLRGLRDEWQKDVEYCLKESDRLADAQEWPRSDRMLTRGRVTEQRLAALDTLVRTVEGR